MYNLLFIKAYFAESLCSMLRNNQPLINFWKNLAPGYSYFEEHKKLVGVGVDKKGVYVFGG